MAVMQLAKIESVAGPDQKERTRHALFGSMNFNWSYLSRYDQRHAPAIQLSR